MEDPPASEGENGGARMPGEPAEEREEGPCKIILKITFYTDRTIHLVRRRQGL